jgi:hypothetical protein
MTEIIPFKDHSKILSSEFNVEENSYTYTFTKDVKFLDSSLLDFLPSGIIHKGKTGFGATTFELNCKRNSIIVEPLKVTASSKAGDGHLYIGSESIKFPFRVTDEQILDYIHNPQFEYKKIICVSDSLPRLEKVLEDKFLGFFLMIDESDSLQIESNYRESMNKVFSIYKKHPRDKRCMISATLINFNDPDLTRDNRINFKFEKKEKRDITILTTRNHLGVVADKILDIYKNNPNEKIVFAFNNVSVLIILANFLVGKGVSKDQISILCGASSQGKSSEFFKELEDQNLPSRIVLKTSAYYTGFDIVERYHLIIAVVTSDFLNIPSDKRISQIVGRARDGLISETIVLNYTERPDHKDDDYSLEFLKNIAETQIQVFKCIQANYKGNKFLKERRKETFKAILEQNRIEGYKLVDFNEDKPNVSYLAIDAILEAVQSKKELYRTKNGLIGKLEKAGHAVNYTEKDSKSKVSKQIDPEEVEIRKKMIEDLAAGNLTDQSIKEQLAHHENKIIKKVSEFYLKYKYFFNKEDLKELILDNWDNNKKMHDLVKKVEFFILPENSHEKNYIKGTFKIGEILTRKEIVNNMKGFYQIISLGGLLDKTEKEIMTEFKLMVECDVARNGNLKQGKEKVKILGYNTLGAKYSLRTKT